MGVTLVRRRGAGLRQITDHSVIEKAVDAIIAANPDKVEAVKAKPAMLGWFVGQVMKSTGGKANPQAVNEPPKKKLGVEGHQASSGIASRCGWLVLHYLLMNIALLIRPTVDAFLAWSCARLRGSTSLSMAWSSCSRRTNRDIRRSRLLFTWHCSRP